MVLETIDTISHEQLATDASKQDFSFSPLSMSSSRTSAAPEVAETPTTDSRDAPLPCDSIRSYANELAASKSITLGAPSGDDRDRTSTPLAILIPAVAEQREEPEPEAEAEAEAAAPVANVPAAEPLERKISVLSETSAESVEIVAVKEDGAKPEAVEEKPVEEEATSQVEEEAKPVEDEAKPEAEEVAKPVEQETKPVEEIAAAESDVKAAISIDESHVEKEEDEAGSEKAEKTEDEPKPEAVADVETASSDKEISTKKKFGLKSFKKSSISKPNLSVPAMPKRAASPTMTKGLTKGLSKPNLSKPGVSKPKLSMSFGKRSKKSKEKTATEDATEEPTMENVDLNDDKNTEAPSAPLEQSCSAFFLEQNNTMQVNEAEALESTKEGDDADEEESLPEVQVTPQVTELVTKAPETEAAKVATAAAMASPQEKFEPNIIDTLYSRIEEGFGDVTNLCGPKSKSMKMKSSGDDESVASDQKDEDDDGAAAPFPLPENLMTPISIATERAQSFMGDILENESFKSIVDNMAAGFDSVAKHAEQTIYGAGASAAEKVEEDKLDEAAEMAKKALDEGAAEEENEEDGEEKAKKPAASKRKSFFHRSTSGKEKEKETTKSDKPPTLPTSPNRLSLFKRGLSSRTKSATSKTKSAGNAAGKSANDMKKVAKSSFLRFKKPRSLSRKKSNKNVLMSSESIASRDIQADLVESTSMNSQSLNEPQTSIAEETAPTVTEETPKVEETHVPAAEETLKQEEEACEAPAADAEKSAAIEEEPAAAALVVDELEAEQPSEPSIVSSKPVIAATKELKSEETPVAVVEEASKLEEETSKAEQPKVEETPATATEELTKEETLQ
mmetsp:Transcript_6371/g.14408  ORF Transcript_6371/g.14408 Transcript_6371/m.14408 type:complete len:849 (+) Transcript_6371:112-2658(+)